MTMLSTINIPISDYSFELPVIQTPGGFLDAPTNSNWTWGSITNGTSGITAENSNYTAPGLAPPDGVQAAFLRGVGYFSQMVTIPADGSYWVYFYATQNIHLNQAVVFWVDQINIGTYFPTNGTYGAQITSVEFRLGAGQHTISFVGYNATAEATVIIDNITMQGMPLPISLTPSATITASATRQAQSISSLAAAATESSQLFSVSNNRTMMAVAISLSSVAILLGVALIFIVRCLRRPLSKNPYFNLRHSWRSSKDDVTTNASTATSPRSTRIIREPEKAAIRPDSPTLPDVAERFGIGRFLASGGRDNAPQPSAPPISNSYDGMSDDSFWEKKSRSSLEIDTDSWPELQL